MTEQEDNQKAQSILDSLTKALDMAPMVVGTETAGALAESKAEAKAAGDRSAELIDDFDFARKNIKRVIEDATSNLNQLMMIARASEHPRAFEVVSTYVNTLVSANESLIDLHKKKTTAETPSPKKSATDKPPSIQQQNNVFVGTPEELQALLNKQDGKIIDHEPTDSSNL